MVYLHSMEDAILILDFGSQYTQLIARRVRELNVYCEIHPFHSIPSGSEKFNGIILSGSPFSTLDRDAPKPDLSNFIGTVPVLGVCYGAQYLAKIFGGEVAASKHREYGRARINSINSESDLLDGVPKGSPVWMSHGDTITNLPKNCSIES